MTHLSLNSTQCQESCVFLHSGDVSTDSPQVDRQLAEAEAVARTIVVTLSGGSYEMEASVMVGTLRRVNSDS